MPGQLTQRGRQLVEGHPMHRPDADHGVGNPHADESFAREAAFGHRRDLFEPETNLERAARAARELHRRLDQLADARIWAAAWRARRRRTWLPRPSSVPASALLP